MERLSLAAATFHVQCIRTLSQYFAMKVSENGFHHASTITATLSEHIDSPDTPGRARVSKAGCSKVVCFSSAIY